MIFPDAQNGQGFHRLCHPLVSQFYDEIELDGYFILIPDMESYAKILGALGMPVF